jgi:phosphopantetheine adenylyltransferase
VRVLVDTVQHNYRKCDYIFVQLISVCRYGKVIAVVGMNPNKKYLVSPEERVQLIRSMLSNNDKLNNVKAQGTKSC